MVLIRSLHSTVMIGAEESSMVSTRMWRMRSALSALSIHTPSHSDTAPAMTSTETV